VDIRAAQAGIRDPEAKRPWPNSCWRSCRAATGSNHTLLTAQLEAVGSDENFMVED
jgi:hypothetical protein